MTKHILKKCIFGQDEVAPTPAPFYPTPVRDYSELYDPPGKPTVQHKPSRNNKQYYTTKQDICRCIALAALDPLWFIYTAVYAKVKRKLYVTSSLVNIA